ncbi:MAG: cell division protein [Rhodospirillales bacterium]|nr:cell division protein [Rhodospirillales bacterium]MCW8861195.1 cell division protein [Rhodospirillales bacterium]MCW8951281.1 cell division protein [Rhodospirillales bacterium]MCW8971197.1 cell division protein [Rhodospirillales bacterium]MCW9002666.1 cell division protein [Rhodospirillales bacterium]
MLGKRSDLPLQRDPTTRFLPWLVAFMVYLAVLAVAGAMTLDEMIGRWEAGITHTLTVQIPPEADGDADRTRVQAILADVLDTAGVTHARIVERDDVVKLLEPWLGNAGAVGDLPLPHLIDVDVESESAVDITALREKLSARAPGASVDDHGVWLQRLIELTRSVQLLAAAVVTLIAAVTIATVIFATRAGLAVHRRVIEVLHLIGAQDSYIARQFGRHAMLLGLKGGFIGLALAAPTLLAVGLLADRLETVLLPDVSLSKEHWIILCALPFLAAITARITARLTVQRALLRML